MIYSEVCWNEFKKNIKFVFEIYMIFFLKYYILHDFLILLLDFKKYRKKIYEGGFFLLNWLA